MSVPQLILFSVFSLIEYLALFTFMFILFKFSVKQYIKHIGLMSILLLYISHSTRFEYHIPFLSSFIQALIVFLFLWLFFKIHHWYAFIMVVAGYGGYTALQFLTFNILSLLSIITLNDLENYKFGSYLLAALTASIAFLLSWITYKNGLGFSLVPYTQRVKVSLTGINTAILGAGIISTAIFIIVFYLYSIALIQSFVLFTIMFIATLGVLFYLIKKKDMAGD